MKAMNDITSNATAKIDGAIDYVNDHIRKVLIKAGIPITIAKKYSANYCHGGEWILDDGLEFAQHDIHLISNEELIEVVKELENLE